MPDGPPSVGGFVWGQVYDFLSVYVPTGAVNSRIVKWKGAAGWRPAPSHPAVRYNRPAMSGTGPDFYRRHLAESLWTWNERKGCAHFMAPRRRKRRACGRADKRRARHESRVEILESL